MENESNVIRIVQNSENLENNLTKEDSDFSRQISHVEDSCFGYLDEEQDECMKMCRLRGACAVKRHEILLKISEEAEKQDAQNRKFQNLDAKLDSIKEMREDVGISEWAKEDDD